ncbi:hypothetical protein CCACVL1_23857 [Corchorus capsularis]|uniref:Uncharacterized protein n=1 Tax=Corchorus capsularis TaxID=210143 RepID=A0A1R3GS02_COCAP|nr:hypothetical protein CCACVL1_23857 [Corchorus capsularis]
MAMSMSLVGWGRLTWLEAFDKA